MPCIVTPLETTGELEAGRGVSAIARNPVAGQVGGAAMHRHFVDACELFHEGGRVSDQKQGLQLTNKQSQVIVCVRPSCCHCSFVYSTLSGMLFVPTKLFIQFF